MSRDGALLGIETSVQDLARKLAESLPVTIASVALWDRPSFSLTVKAIATPRPLAAPLPLASRVPLGSAPSHRVVFEHGQPVFVDLESPVDAAAREEVAQALIPDLRAIYLVPIQFGEERVGVLGLGEMRSAAREPISPEKRERCRTILEEFVASSEHAWQAGRLRQQGRAMLSLLRMVREMFGAKSVEDVLAVSTAEVAGWLGVPVRSLLFRLDPEGQIEIAAAYRFPHPVTPADAAQILLAFIRSRGTEEWPVGVVSVADDPLDPLRPVVPDSGRWTRITLPLMSGERLLGVICLYVEDVMRPRGWELEAFRHRAEIASRGLALVAEMREHAVEREWLGRIAYETLTASQRAALNEALVGIHRLVTTLVRDRVYQLRAELGESSSPAGPELETVAESLTREVAAVLDGLRAEVPGPEPWMREVDINALVRRVTRMASTSLQGPAPRRRGPVQLSLELSSTPLLARTSPELLTALVHALDNAAEAMPEGGRIRVRTSREDGHAVISVEDSGPGVAIPEDEAFAPLVSTKGKPHLGLGLSVIRSVVGQHGGTASLASAEDGGGRLQIRLPLAAGEIRDGR